MCDTIHEMLYPAKEWGKAMKYVSHQSSGPDFHWKMEPSQVYYSAIIEPNTQSSETDEFPDMP